MSPRPVTTADVSWIGIVLRRDDLAQCKAEYGPFFDSPLPTFTTVALSIAIVVLTIAVEVIAHSGNSSDTAASNSDDNVATSARSNHSGARPSPPAKAKSPGPPSLKLRASRFVAATAAFTILCTCAYFRFQIIHTFITNHCRDVIPEIAPLNWPVIALVNILPFSCAVFAWLRTLVDCVLARWNKTVSSKWWPALFPLACLVCILGALWITFQACVLKAMGGDASQAWEPCAEDGAMGAQRARDVDEEEMGLMQNVDGHREAEAEAEAEPEGEAAEAKGGRDGALESAELDRKGSPPPYSASA